MSVSLTNRLITALALTVGLCTAPGCATVPKHSAQPELVAPPCPAGSAQTLKTLGIVFGESVLVKLELAKTNKWGGLSNTPVKPGLVYVSTVLEQWGDLPIGTRFKGELHIQEDRVYGWFTEVFVPEKGPMPVCMEIHNSMKDHSGDAPLGTDNVRPGPNGSTIINPTAYLGPTNTFHTHY